MELISCTVCTLIVPKEKDPFESTDLMCYICFCKALLFAHPSVIDWVEKYCYCETTKQMN